MSNKIQEIFFSLLRAGLSGEKGCSLIGYGSLTMEDWQRIYELSAEQGLTGIVFSAIEQLPKSQLPPMDLLMDWLGQVEYIVSCNHQYRQDAADFMNVLEGADGLKVIILKGMACAEWYPMSQRRSLGDLDIICLADNGDGSGRVQRGYDMCNDLCTKRGLKVEYHDYKHSKISYKSLTIENHRLLTAARGGKDKKDFERELQRLLIAGEEAQFNALFLTIHAFQHFMTEGLSLRQICDWAMFLKNNHEGVDWKKFYEWTDSMRLTRFAEAMNTIAVKYLGVIGLKLEVRQDSALAERILHETMNAKNRIDKSGVDGVRYYWLQIKTFIHNNWKYRELCEYNALVAYMKAAKEFLTEKEPEV